MKSILLAFLLFATLAGLSSAFQKPFSFQPNSSHRGSRLHSSLNDQNLSSVGDYVKQVHGGKYQFNDAGINSIGQEFAETGYGSSAPKEDAEASLLAEIPRWANRMGTEDDIQSKIKGVLDVHSGPVSIDIANDELTWEPFYIKITTSPDDPSSRDFCDTQPLSVHPQAGTLAPRGGAENLCDPNDPYLDSATIWVEKSGDLSEQEPLFLLIGTEEEKWYYRIQL